MAISSNGERWFLLNASPDLHRQIESFPPLLPPPGQTRGTRIQGVLLTNADLDHCLGLPLLREGPPLAIHAAASVRRALNKCFQLGPLLENYCGAQWRQPPFKSAALLCADGSESGLRYQAFRAPGKPPRYAETRYKPSPGDNTGYVITDERSGARLVYLPGAAALDKTSLRMMEKAAVVLIDGTFWSEDEMQRSRTGAVPASAMGHIPISGPDGSLERLSKLSAKQVVYVHINNTNPILLEDSPERLLVNASNVKVGYDGMEFFI